MDYIPLCLSSQPKPTHSEIGGLQHVLHKHLSDAYQMHVALASLLGAVVAGLWLSVPLSV